MRRRPRAREVSAVALFAGVLLGGGTSARSGFSLPYGLPTVYHTAVRLLRIDRGCQITERDPDAAYLLFECRDGRDKDSKVRRGALELYAAGSGVKGQLTLLDEPRYMEQRLIDLLRQKLRDERGDPPAAPPPPAAKPNPDGGQP